MVSNIKIFLLCPIPEDQKPINEYIEIKENPLFTWSTLKNKEYYSKLFFIYIFFLFIFLPFQFTEFNLNQIISLFFYSLTFFLLFLIVIYLRWKEIQLHFNKARLFYEEASWFDGQIWEKPFFLIKNDKLISSQKIEPILQRLFSNICIIALIEITLFILFEFGFKTNYN
jgi:hypothetical protein